MRHLILVAATTLALSASIAQAQTPQRFASQAGPIVVEQVAKGLANPWGLAFLPDGRMLVTERPGTLRLVTMDGAISRPLGGVPQVSARNQGGLLDIRLDPDFARNRALYICFAEPRAGGNGTSVARATLTANADALSDVRVIFRQEPTYQGGHHFGCRIVPDRTGALFITLGDRYNLRDEAQNPANHLGKIVRIRPDGAIPPDNPAPSGQRPEWKPEIWSIGHRNVQGAALHPETGQLWTAEHGARGGDEVNTPKKGLNYGWPVITYGIDYSGVKIGEGTAKAGMEQPVFYWDPSIAPSGAAFYTGDAFPAWKGSLFVGALAGQRLSRLTIRGEAVSGEEQLLMGLNKRIRDVRQGPDGLLYLVIDDPNGEVLRLKPGG
ncbi:MAG: PQQ-dependent sugar dehydrogenase [Bosea sp. (in: a-proteobacteria)]